jgi:acyl-coenzyme A thioesterase 13
VAIVGADPLKAGVSLEMSIGYVSAAKIGERITCEGRVIKLGGRIAFTEVVIKGADGRVVATGRHTKAI